MDIKCSIFYTDVVVVYINHEQGRRGCELMVLGFKTTSIISAYRHYSNEFESRSRRNI